MIQKSYKLRILIVTIALLFMFLGAAARLYHLQVLKHDMLKRLAEENHVRKRPIIPLRGEICDRQGNPLVFSASVYSVNVDPNLIKERDYHILSKRLSPILKLPQDKILDLLKKNTTNFPLTRKVSEGTMQEVTAALTDLGINRVAIYPQKETRRLYPKGTLLASVLGFTNMDNVGDNIGVFGLEREYNDWICGEYKKIYPHRTALFQDLEPIEQEILEATYGNRLILTIDQSIQYALERALRTSIAKSQADYGVAVVQDVRTGEILALCSLPTFDPNNFYSYSKEFRQNRCVSNPFEPGSVMKIFTTTILLDRGLVRLDELIDCQEGHAIVDGWRVTDAGGHGMKIVPFTQCFYNSSNVAFAKLGIRIDPAVYYSYLHDRFMFGQKTGIDLPEESVGILHPLSKWHRHSRKSLAYGYEIALTPIQTICAVSAIGNGGKLMKPYIVSEIQDYKGNTIRQFTPSVRGQVARPETVQKVLQLMEDVIDVGTGKKAKIKGYRIGGKTGTTHKSQILDRTEYIASFAAIFPIENPQISCYIAIDNPKGAYYAADVAAPVFREVAEQILAHLALPATVVEPEPHTHIAASKPIPTPTPTPEATTPPPAIANGVMPDLKGMTMKEVMDCLGNTTVDVKFIGTGIVIEQTPPPATALSDAQNFTVVFGKPESPDATDAPAPVANAAYSAEAAAKVGP